MSEEEDYSRTNSEKAVTDMKRMTSEQQIAVRRDLWGVRGVGVGVWAGVRGSGVVAEAAPLSYLSSKVIHNMIIIIK